MLIRHIGHAEFLIETESGLKIVIDPYDASCGYPVEKLTADVALVSHHHHDHDAADLLEGNPRVIDAAGEYTPESGVKLTALTGDHDEAGGTKRGKTLHFLLEAEGLKAAHLGDLGTELTRETAEQLGARIILPMHYKTRYNADWPISGPEAFLDLYDKADIREGGEILRVTRGDRSCQPKVFLFAQK